MLHASDKYNGRIIDKEGLIPADEPVFLLRAQDPLSIDLLEDYIEKLEQELDERVPNITDDNVQKLDDLRPHLDRFRDWQALHPDKVKLPD